MLGLGLTVDHQQSEANAWDEATGGGLRDLPSEDGPLCSPVPENPFDFAPVPIRSLRGRMRAHLPQKLHHHLGKHPKQMSDRLLHHHTMIVFAINLNTLARYPSLILYIMSIYSLAGVDLPFLSILLRQLERIELFSSTA